MSSILIERVSEENEFYKFLDILTHFEYDTSIISFKEGLIEAYVGNPAFTFGGFLRFSVDKNSKNYKISEKKVKVEMLKIFEFLQKCKDSNAWLSFENNRLSILSLKGNKKIEVSFPCYVEEKEDDEKINDVLKLESKTHDYISAEVKSDILDDINNASKITSDTITLTAKEKENEQILSIEMEHSSMPTKYRQEEKMTLFNFTTKDQAVYTLNAENIINALYPIKYTNSMTISLCKKGESPLKLSTKMGNISFFVYIAQKERR